MGIETPITDRIGQAQRAAGFRAAIGCAGSLWPPAGMPCYVAAMEAPDAETQRVFAPGILRHQVAIVTGGGSGIGLATAHELVRLGARVAICGRTADKLEAAAEQLRDAGGTVLARPCDIREAVQVEAFVSAVLGELGRIDILVNN